MTPKIGPGSMLLYPQRCRLAKLTNPPLGLKDIIIHASSSARLTEGPSPSLKQRLHAADVVGGCLTRGLILRVNFLAEGGAAVQRDGDVGGLVAGQSFEQNPLEAEYRGIVAAVGRAERPGNQRVVGAEDEVHRVDDREASLLHA